MFARGWVAGCKVEGAALEIGRISKEDYREWSFEPLHLTSKPSTFSHLFRVRVCFVVQPVTARVAYFNVVAVDDAKKKYFPRSFLRARLSGPDSGLRGLGLG